jgi:methionyl-tRNA formyltransferase
MITADVRPLDNPGSATTATPAARAASTTTAAPAARSTPTLPAAAGSSTAAGSPASFAARQLLRVDVLCTDPQQGVNAWLERWAGEVAPRARVNIQRDQRDLGSGDFLFLVSCQQIIRAATRSRYRHTLVLHASALPQGRGMSPQVWQVLEGRDGFTVTLLEAHDDLDCGRIWQQREVEIPATALYDEINARLFDAEIELMTWALTHCDHFHPRPQVGTPTWYRRRTPDDSRIDPELPLADQFDLLRVADPQRYPAFFDHRGQRYRIRIDKL